MLQFLHIDTRHIRRHNSQADNSMQRCARLDKFIDFIRMKFKGQPIWQYDKCQQNLIDPFFSNKQGRGTLVHKTTIYHFTKEMFESMLLMGITKHNALRTCTGWASFQALSFSSGLHSYTWSFYAYINLMMRCDGVGVWVETWPVGDRELMPFYLPPPF